MVVTVHQRGGTVQTTSATVQFRLMETPGRRRATPVLTATVRAGTVVVATGAGEAPILEGTVRMGAGVVAEPGGTVSRIVAVAPGAVGKLGNREGIG